MYCKCGCGQITKIAKFTDTSKGWVKGQHLHFIHRHRRVHRLKAGQEFGLWTVVKEDGKNCNKAIMWLCQCICGRYSRVKTTDLIHNHSMGCRSCAQIGKHPKGNLHPNYKHGEYIGTSTGVRKRELELLQISAAYDILRKYAPESLNPLWHPNHINPSTNQSIRTNTLDKLIT